MRAEDAILVRPVPMLEMANTSWEDFWAVDAREPEIELFSPTLRNTPILPRIFGLNQ
jgi:hypothetical protein